MRFATRFARIILAAAMVMAAAGCSQKPEAAQGTSAAAQETQAVEAAQKEDKALQAESSEPSSEASQERTGGSIGGGNTLVVYFSATGNTKTVAGYIADCLGADQYEIVPEEPYTSDDLNWRDESSRVSTEHEDPDFRPAIAGDGTDLSSYDTIFLGYPIWWGEAPNIVRTWMESVDLSGKTVVPFCTSASSGLGSSAQTLQGFAKDANWLDGQRFPSSVGEEEVAEWVNGLGLQSQQSTSGGSADSKNIAGASTVYFTSDISPAGLMAVYQALNWEPSGKVAVKLSTGEPPASNYLDPELIKDLVQSVNGTIVECNTAYGGSRAETAMHRQVAEDHGFTAIAEVDILDAEGSMELPVEGGNRLDKNLVGGHFADYDSYLVLSHFKGHAMAGFGGAVKNISIGLGSQEGKCLIHTAGESNTSPWGGDQTGFTESMAEAGKSVSDYLGHGERIVYVNVLNNISIDCDCNGNPAEPDIHDIGIVASLDPVAIDQACIDLAFAAEGSEALQARVNDRDGLHTLEHGEEIGLGSRTYELVNIDD